ncbi:MAG TPA: PKD domain-containing protein [Vicinamibacterales bacterium]|nr:PKD domain-containing protein [Vicinamibacterales bacterium]
MARTKIWIAALTLLAAVGCTMHKQDAPSLTGPSEFGTSITISANPDVVTEDGSSQALLTVTARDANGQPYRNLSMRVDTVVGNIVADTKGTLSARNIVTDNNGQASAVYTAPFPQGCNRSNFPTGCVVVDDPDPVSIRVLPMGTDFGNETPRYVSIRLVPPGVIIPPSDIVSKFSITPSSASDHQDVQFDGSASTDTYNAIASYSWDFGDGDHGSGKVTTHSFDAPGTYFVSLTVKDSYGRSAQSSQAITIGAATGPTAAFVYSPSSPALNQTVNFNAGTSTVPAGHSIVSYRWNFGDGATGSGVTTSHAYGVAGTYTVVLTVTDDDGHVATGSQTLSIGTPGAPTADFIFSPTNPVATQTVFFDGTISKVPSGRSISNYAWKFGDGSSGSGPTPTHAFAAVGSYTVLLTVTDDTGQTATRSQTVLVSSDAPVAKIVASATSGTTATVFGFDASSSTAAGGRTIASYNWSFGDPTSGPGNNASTLANPTHTFSTGGQTYTVTLTVVDSASKSSTTTLIITIS